MVYGLIICAGKQSRFKSETPKALVDVNGKTLLERNMSALEKFCDRVFVVCSFENEAHFKLDNKIVIESGKGSGDAVWKALERLDVKKDDTCFVMWGDSMQSEATFSALKENYAGTTLIPCQIEEKPYVQITKNGKGGVNVLFSKFGDKITRGFHDLSVFYCNAVDLLKGMRAFRRKFLDESGNYVHKHNNEMEFLDVFNDTDIKADILEFKDGQDFSFNTIEQLEELLKKSTTNTKTVD